MTDKLRSQCCDAAILKGDGDCCSKCGYPCSPTAPSATNARGSEGWSAMMAEVLPCGHTNAQHMYHEAGEFKLEPCLIHIRHIGATNVRELAAELWPPSIARVFRADETQTFTVNSFSEGHDFNAENREKFERGVAALLSSLVPQPPSKEIEDRADDAALELVGIGCPDCLEDELCVLCQDGYQCFKRIILEHFSGVIDPSQPQQVTAEMVKEAEQSWVTYVNIRSGVPPTQTRLEYISAYITAQLAAQSLVTKEKP